MEVDDIIRLNWDSNSINCYIFIIIKNTQVCNILSNVTCALNYAWSLHTHKKYRKTFTFTSSYELFAATAAAAASELVSLSFLRRYCANKLI